MYLVCISVGPLVILNEVLHGFPQSCHMNPRVVPPDYNLPFTIPIYALFMTILPSCLALKTFTAETALLNNMRNHPATW